MATKTMGMNLSTVNVVMFLAGTILVYSGIKGYKPASVLAWALGGSKPTGWDTKENPMGGPGHNGVPPEKGPGADPGQSHPGDKFYPPGTENGGEPTSPASDTNNPPVLSV